MSDMSAALNASETFHEHPVMITRELSQAKKWVRDNTRGMRRYGLVASSGAGRLRAFGLETSKAFRDGYSYEDWFLRPPNNVRSSFQLEVVATEFEIQGLELDKVVMCWGGDFTWNPISGSWDAAAFRGTKWARIKDADHDQYDRIRNKYRVLLTRSRETLIIWVPTGNKNDLTQKHKEMDSTYDYLLTCGATPME